MALLYVGPNEITLLPSWCFRWLCRRCCKNWSMLPIPSSTDLEAVGTTRRDQSRKKNPHVWCSSYLCTFHETIISSKDLLEREYDPPCENKVLKNSSKSRISLNGSSMCSFIQGGSHGNRGRIFSLVWLVRHRSEIIFTSTPRSPSSSDISILPPIFLSQPVFKSAESQIPRKYHPIQGAAPLCLPICCFLCDQLVWLPDFLRDRRRLSDPLRDWRGPESTAVLFLNGGIIRSCFRTFCSQLGIHWVLEISVESSSVLLWSRPRIDH